ncbi:MAG TPA: hypothetical protein PLB89_18120 [Flavobacteriales bacterium]|nr:hypothetical protein [Flavobacteriales bacterium]
MRKLLLAIMLAPLLVMAQDPATFARAINSGNTKKLDRWMKRELHRQRKGHLQITPSASYYVHDPTFDTLVAFIREQPGVSDAAWDKCIGKIDIWPGHSRIGLRFDMNGSVHERCYSVQEGIPGVIRLPGWRPRVRKDREHLKYLVASDCPGFVEEQRRHCATRQH